MTDLGPESRDQATYPTVRGNDHLGAVTVRFSDIRLRHALLRDFVIGGLVFAVLGITIVLALSQILTRLVVRPLRDLDERIGRIAMGESDIDVAAFQGRHDEIGSLARSLDHMRRAIEASIAEQRRELAVCPSD